MSSLKCQLGSRGSNFTMWLEKHNQEVDVIARIGAKRDPVPPKIFLERLFKPSVIWEGESSNTSMDPNTPPNSEPSDTIGGSATEITSSTHEIMVVIAPWTEPFLAYFNRQQLPEDQNEARCIV